MDRDNWFWYLIFFMAFSFLLFIGIMQLVNDKPVRYYYLEDDAGGALSIGVDIDNHPDSYISMNGHTLQEVVSAIDSLNKSLPPYK